VARLLFDATELESFLCLVKKNYQKLCTKAPSIVVHLATTNFCKSGFSSLLQLKNKCWNRYQQAYVLREVILKMKMLQNRTVFVISSIFSNEGVQMPLQFYESGASFKKGWEPMFYWQMSCFSKFGFVALVLVG